MKHFKLEFVLRAAQPIAHHAGSDGNHASLMREGVLMPDGERVDIPIVSGDSMRHQLRESMAMLTLHAAGMLETPALSQGAVRLLFAGGGIGGGQEASIDIEEYHRICDLSPGLALLGGAVGNRILPGSAKVGRAMLICEESVDAGVIPGWVTEGRAAPPAADCIAVETRVRMDPMDRPRNRALLGAEAQADYAARIIAGEKAADAKAKSEAKGTMMPRSFETVVAGSLFYWTVECACLNEVQEHAFWAMLSNAVADLSVGGKSGTGHGKMRVVECREHDWLDPIAAAKAINPLGIGRDHIEAFRSHIADNAAELEKWLSGVSA